MFLFSKILPQLFFPLTLYMILALVGTALLWSSVRRRTGRIIVTVALLMLALFAYGWVANPFLESLETQYPAYPNEPAQEDIDYVVVLGAGNTSDGSLPPTSRVDSDSLIRLVEGIRIFRMHPGSRLLLSGGANFDPVPVGKAMADLAVAIGVDPDDILVEDRSRNTEDEARLIESVVGEKPFVLVTSASHLPRAMAIFEKHGMSPTPAPTAHLAKRSGSADPSRFFPRVENLAKAQAGVYELLGTLWARSRGQM